MTFAKLGRFAGLGAVVAGLVLGFQNCSLQSPDPGATATTNPSVDTKSLDIVFDSIPTDVTFYISGTGSIAVVASSTGGFALSYQWYKDGVALPGQNSSTLALPNVQASDAGKYKIVVTNSTGSNWLEINVTVSASPVITFTTQPQPITIMAAGSGTLTSLAVSSDNQSLIYQWKKDGVNLAGFNTPSITISNAAPVVAGLYQVEVRSTQGPQQIILSNSVRVTVQGTFNVNAANGCVNGYCACVTGGQLGVPHAPSALAICTLKGYSTLVTFSTGAGIRGAAQCSADGASCFINANVGNIICTSVTCSR